MQENRRPTRHDRRQVRLAVPQRDGDTDGLSPVRTPSVSQPAKKPGKGAPSPDGGLFGFDDIPVDDEKMDDVRFVDILRAWTKRAIQHSPLERYVAASKAKKKHLKQLSNDLKWAMQADLDEPVAPRPKQPRRQKPTTTPPVTNHADTSETKTIDININFGSLPQIRREAIAAKVRKVLQNKKIVALSSAIIIALFGYFVVWPLSYEYIFDHGRSGDLAADTKAPEYSTVLPKDKPISDLGGWKRVSPMNRDPVFAYADKISDIAISVSQQPLPETFKSDVNGKVADLAEQFTATNKLDANGTNVYVGTSAKGPQSVIFTKNGLLVLIKSQSKVDDKSWIAYVESLVGTDPSLSHY